MTRRTLLRAGSAAAFSAVGQAISANPQEAQTKVAHAAASFPPHFLWGAATAAHQVEGNDVNSDLWILEHLEKSMFKEPSGDACDEYHLYEDDISMLADLGLNAYRFSINWARIEPAKNEFSRVELSHYRRVLETCHRHGVTPLVTFAHVTTPRWFAYEGGWENPTSVDRFVRYCDESAKYLGDLVAWAATFNEPNLMRLLSWVRLPDGQRLTDVMAESQAQARQQLKAEKFATFLGGNPDMMQQNMLAAHQKGKAAIKSAYPKLPVGLTLAMEDDQAAGPQSRLAEKRKEAYGPWLELARQDDFIGVQTYTRQRIGNGDANLTPPKNAELTQSGYEFYPEALEHTIRYASQQTGVPVIVTENGVATDDDGRRVEYIRRAVEGMRRCLADRIDMRGYLYWSLLDNFEWVSGYSQKFGLVAVDRATQRRTIKPSASYLGKLATS